MPEALPAVTVPSFLKAGFILPSDSMVAAALQMLVGIEHDLALAGLLDDREDLGLEIARIDGRSGTTLGFDGEGILLFTGDAMLGSQVLGGDAHVADTERVGQHGNHGVDGLGITHAGTAAQRRHQVSGLGHDFDATADAVVGIAEQDVLGSRHDALQAGSAQTGNLHRDGFHRQASLDRGDAGDVSVAGVGRHGGANGDVVDQLRIDGGTGDRLFHDETGQLTRIEIGEGAAKSTDRGTDCTQNDNFTTSHLISSFNCYD